MAFRSPPPHRHSSGNLHSRRVWKSFNKYDKPHAGAKELERRRHREAEITFQRVMRGVVDACLLQALEEGIYL